MLKRFLTKSCFAGTVVLFCVLVVAIAVARFLGQVVWTDWLLSFAEVESWVFFKIPLVRIVSELFSRFRVHLLPLWLDRSCRKLRGHHRAGGENPKRVALQIHDVTQVQDTRMEVSARFQVEEISKKIVCLLRGIHRRRGDQNSTGTWLRDRKNIETCAAREGP